MNHHPRIIAAAAATVATVAPSALAVIDSVGDGIGNEYLIQTTGATALKAFTSADGNRGTYLLGLPTLTIGDTVYSLDGSIAQGIGQQVNGSPTIIEPGNNADRIVYGYHETGSGNGINDLAIRNGLLPGSPPNISSSNPHFTMGEEFSSFPVGSLTNGHGAFYNGTPNQKAVPGVSGAFYDYTTSDKPLPQIAYSDVSFEQFFALSGNASFDARPTTSGYGRGQDATQYSSRRFTASGENYQDLRSADALDGGVTPGTTKLRNTALAAVPFTISANPGTGLDSISESDARFLQAVGRLENGVNFHSVTRDSGSGTRNQGSNNLVLDPSFGQGERDRVQLIDANGDAIGAEANPRRDRLGGGSSPNTAEYGPSAIATFADKRSGSSALRPTVQSQRLALGVLSVGDVGTRGSDPTQTRPVRVLAIDFEGDDFVGTGDPGAVQPTADNVTSGKYQLWSAAQAVTVRGTLATGADANGQLSGGVSESATDNGALFNADGSLASGTILNDVDDDGSGTGIVKKFLQNITSEGSLQDFTAPDPNTVTPLDSIIAAGFIPLPLMDVTKEFDGDTQTTNTRSANADAIYAGSAGDALRQNLTFARAGDFNGNVSQQLYRIYDVANTSDKRNAPQGNVEIPFTDRIFLAGDLSGDGVRDLEDVEAWAAAIADTDGFLDDNADITSGGPTVITTAPGGELDGSDVLDQQRAGLLALTDLNGDGNVEVVGPDGVIAYTPENYAAFGANAGVAGGVDRVVAISREDARFFLFGHTVDTSESADGSMTFTTAQERRELGVRFGQLKKNEGIARFNAELDQLALDGAITQAVADANKFDPFDVDFDDDSDLDDARAVNRNVGRDYTNLADAIASGDDLVAAELTDDTAITFVTPAGGPESDFERIYNDLVSTNEAVVGDFDLNGNVALADFGLLRAGFGNSSVGVGYQSGDADFDGDVDIADFGSLRANFGLSAGMAPVLADVADDLDVEVIVDWETGEVTLVGTGELAGLQILGDDGELLADAGETLGLTVLANAHNNFALGSIDGSLSLDGELSLGQLVTTWRGEGLSVALLGAGNTVYSPALTLIPEPTVALAGIAAGGLFLRRRRA